MLNNMLLADSIFEGALGGALKGAIVGAIAGPLVWLVLMAQKRWGKKDEDGPQTPPSNS